MMVGDSDTQVSELGPSGPSCYLSSQLGLDIAYKRYHSSMIENGNAHHHPCLHMTEAFNNAVRWHFVSLYTCFNDGSLAPQS